MRFGLYGFVPEKYFDEMVAGNGEIRASYRTIASWLDSQPKGGLKQKARDAEAIFRRLGITFAVYGSGESNERLIPFDIIPRIISAAEWRKLERGIEQRVRAMNAFMHDIYHKATGPIVQRLRERWHDVSRQELEVLYRKLPNLSEDDQQAIDRTVERIVNKLLHPPLETLRDEAREGTPHGLLDAIMRLFHLH